MALTDEEVRVQVRTLLAERPIETLASVIREENVASNLAAETVEQGPDWTPLAAAAWDKLRDYLLNGNGPIASDDALVRAVMALRANEQAKFWRWMFVHFKAHIRELAHLRLAGVV